jgi:DNA primase
VSNLCTSSNNRADHSSLILIILAYSNSLDVKIPQETIDRIQQSIDIAEVIGDFVQLKKKGQYMMACCPFHNEKTPSFTVTPSKGIYKCFGCGKAGDSIQFIMDIEGLNYLESMKYLAKKYGIEIKEDEQTPEELIQQSERDSLYIVLNYAKNYFHDILLNNSEGQGIGLSYFKERGFSEKTINKFELGYSLEEWEGLLKSAVKNNYKTEILEKAGLIITRENANDSKSKKQYDRFRGRVIFPIHNLTGKVIAFGARILKSDKNQPKYLNSPETEVYHKSKILYGISQAKQAIRQEENCYLVEGYTDVISLHQAGIENVVASSGTSLTEDQIKLISRYTNNITVLYDGDSAGLKASLRGTDMILEEGMNVSVVVFPDGEDPDSYVRKIGGTEFGNFVKSTKKDFITFKTELFLKDAGNDPIKKAEVIKEIIISISKIPDPIKRAVFFKQCSTLLDIDEGTLIAEHNKIKIQDRRNKKQEPEVLPPGEDLVLEELEKKPVTEQDEVALQEREMVRLLINYGSEKLNEGEDEVLSTYILEQIEDDFDFETPVLKKIVSLIKTRIKEEGAAPKIEFFLHHGDAEIRNEAMELTSTRYEMSEHWAVKHQIYTAKPGESLGSRAYNSILRLKKRKIQYMIRINNEGLKKTTDPHEVEEILKIQMRLKNAEKEIAALLGNVVSK